MSVNSYALTSVARAKSFMGIEGSGQDVVLEIIINSISDFFENECGGRRFKKTAYSGNIVDGDGSVSLILPQWPVVSSQSFKIYERDTVGYGDDTWDEVNSDDYRIDYNSGIVRANFAFLKGFQNYKIDYTAGYDFDVNSGKYLSDVGLSDLELAVFKLITRTFNSRKFGDNVQSVNLYNFSVNFMKEAYSDDEIKEIIHKYKRFSF